MIKKVASVLLTVSVIFSCGRDTGNLELTEEQFVEDRIDSLLSVMTLRVKFRLNLFEKPYSKPSDYPDFASEKFAEASFRAAAESITLLKNKNNILPLGKERKRFLKTDYILCCLGEKPATEKPSDIDELELPDAQVDLVKKMALTGKPVIVILVQSRPRIIRELEPYADAILMAYLPGNEGGRALASIVAGDISPSGKLPYTWPKYSGSIMPYYHKGTDKLDKAFGPNGFDPQYEFGYGLSYTNFEYSNLSFNTDAIEDDQTLEVSFTVKNTGEYKGKEVIQVYIRDQFASVSPDAKRLVDFLKVGLSPGKDTSISVLVPAGRLAFVNTQNKRVVEEGRFDMFVGGNPKNLMHKNFYLNKDE